MTTRLLPPPSGLSLSITVNGRSYTATVNGTLDVPDADAFAMAANGWIPYPIHGATVGTTANRPTAQADGITKPVLAGTPYFDTTLSKVVVADGTGSWRDYTGAVV